PTCTPASGSDFPKGTTTVTCNATDASSHTGTCSFTVKVNDTEKPVFTACPSPGITKSTDPGQCSAAVTFNVAASDNCPGVNISCVAGSVSLTPSCTSSGNSKSCNFAGTFPKGSTTVTCHATDAASNNSADCSFAVVVNDNQPPSITCP